MKSILRVFVLLMTSVMVFTGCSDDDKVKTYDYSIRVNVPEEVKDADLSGLSVTITNVNSMEKQTVTTDNKGSVPFTVREGVYTMEVTGELEYHFQESEGGEITQKVQMAGIKENVTLSESQTAETISIDLYIQAENKGWVIKEIYFSGTRTTSGGAYSKDQFIEIYNNTDKVMYADGLSIGNTYQTSAAMPNIYLDDLNNNTFLYAVYTVPGNGTQYPVEPGKSIVIACQPIDHTENNSINLAPPAADFQWYDPLAGYIDVPEVPNLNKYYSASKTVWIFQTQGNKGMIVFKVDDMGMTDFIEKHKDIRKNNANNDVTSIKVPNKYILDAVEFAQQDKFNTKTLSPSLDIGFMYTESTYNGKSVRRKVKSVDNGRIIYQDTNNSTVDFLPNRTPGPKQHFSDEK